MSHAQACFDIPAVYINVPVTCLVHSHVSGPGKLSWIVKWAGDMNHSFEHIQLPAKLLDYFLRSNKSNSNQYMRPAWFWGLCTWELCGASHIKMSDLTHVNNLWLSQVSKSPPPSPFVVVWVTLWICRVICDWHCTCGWVVFFLDLIYEYVFAYECPPSARLRARFGVVVHV